MGNDLFNDEQDPRSLNYVRILKRPQINWFKVVLYVLLPAMVLAALIIGFRHLGVSTVVSVYLAIIVLLVYIMLTLKRAIICVVKIYQRYAPDSVRNKCRFEPSCSEYMILAIEKYGLFRGVRKGIRRLKRCNINGGGFDYP